MTQSRVLLTGANGLLGQSLAGRLHDVPAYDLLLTSRDTKSFYPAHARHATLDVRETERVEEILAEFNPDVFVNCAGMTQVDKCEEQRDECWTVNAEVPGQLADLCHRYDSHLVHISTDFVFDGQDGPYVEDDPTGPVNFYGEAKLAGERAIEASDLEAWSIARTVLLFGTGQNLKRSNIALWIIEELSQEEPVDVVTDQWRTPTYVPDLAAGILQIIERRAQGIYHLSGPELVSVFEFARRIARCLNYDASLVRPTTSEALGQTASRPPKTGFIIDKARAELDFRPQSIESAVNELAAALELQTGA